MDKFVDKKGKVVLKINDDGSQEVHPEHTFKDGTLVITRTSSEEGHYHEFNPLDLSEGTSKVEGHKHDIINSLVQPAGKNGHTHALPMGA